MAIRELNFIETQEVAGGVDVGVTVGDVLSLNLGINLSAVTDLVNGLVGYVSGVASNVVGLLNLDELLGIVGALIPDISVTA